MSKSADDSCHFRLISCPECTPKPTIVFNRRQTHQTKFVTYKTKT